jgi:transcriptional regulator with PAS, ATPase and Fis domain
MTITAHIPTSNAIPLSSESQLDTDWPTLDELSLRYMHKVIERSNGNKTKAAEVLGIDRRTVSRILAKVSRNGRTPTMQTGNR